MTGENTSFEVGSCLNGRYLIRGVLGHGGMGTVYEAMQLPIERTVAIKVLHPSVANEPGAFERFRLEAWAAGSVGHDNICEVTDFGHAEDGTPFLVMPLLKGASLAELLASGEISFHRFIDMMAQALAALQAAHDTHIVHRDLKPENIFVTQVGDRDDFVKLLDFGASKLLSPGELSSLTEAGRILGTPHYMAPEQAMGLADLSEKVDIYAIGVILYEAFTGRKPFNGRTKNEVMVRIVAGAMPTPQSLNPAIPSALNRIILRAMARDADKRHESAMHLKNELLELAGSAVAGFHTVPPCAEKTPEQPVKLSVIAEGSFRPEAPDATQTHATALTGEVEAAPVSPFRKSKTVVLWSSVGLAALLLVLVGVFVPTGPSGTIEMSDKPPTVGPSAVTISTSEGAAAAPSGLLPAREAEVAHAPAVPVEEDRPSPDTEEAVEAEPKRVRRPAKKKRSDEPRAQRQRPSRRKKKKAVFEGRTGTRFYTNY